MVPTWDAHGAINRLKTTLINLLGNDLKRVVEDIPQIGLSDLVSMGKAVLQNKIQLKDLVSKGDALLLLHCIRGLLNDAFQQFEFFGGRHQRHHDFSDWELLGASAHLSGRFEDGARLHPGELLMNCSKQIEPTIPTEVKKLVDFQ